MTRDQVLAQFDACLAICRAPVEPVSRFDRALHRAACAREVAAYEARRARVIQPQLALPKAA